MNKRKQFSKTPDRAKIINPEYVITSRIEALQDQILNLQEEFKDGMSIEEREQIDNWEAAIEAYEDALRIIKGNP